MKQRGSKGMDVVVHHRNFAGSQLPEDSEVLQCTALPQNIESKTSLSWNTFTQEKALESVSSLTIE